jgi:NDP-4-keto-2,6-dideoxyhexose 3-C-methyltransferase
MMQILDSGSLIDSCRACKSADLSPILSLGELSFTGIFESPGVPVPSGELALVGCDPKSGCGLIQLDRDFPNELLYGETYGYRSGLNPSMLSHLESKVMKIMDLVEIGPKDFVIDIGANDGSSLGFYPNNGMTKVAVDPLCEKFIEHYPEDIVRVVDFFTSANVDPILGSSKAKVITSFSMLYDLPEPMGFIADIAKSLDLNGIWVSEQSYAPLMVQRRSYDTICHEHLEYYTLHTLEWMLSRSGLKVVDVELNEVNGGSLSFVAALHNSPIEPLESVNALKLKEIEQGYNSLRPFEEFAQDVLSARDSLKNFVHEARRSGKKIAALGASTKGNVILQYCGLTTEDILVIGDVNPEKWGKVTPGSNIPIVDEELVLKEDYDFLLVLPWHFRKFFERKLRNSGRVLVFPLPGVETVQL